MKIEYRLEESLTLSAFLAEKHYSRELIKALFSMDNAFSVNLQPIHEDIDLKVGDLLRVMLNEEIPYDKTLPILPDIVYEDEYVLVINKPAPLAVIGTGIHYENNLSMMIAFYYQTHGIQAGIHLVNRLDKDTTGLLLVAKHAYIHHLLSLQMNQMERKYRAIIVGYMAEKQGYIDLPIKKKEGEREIRRMVHPDGKKAVTYYNTIDQNELFSLVDLSLKTGRTHQIRVHFSHLGHPLVGDPLYETHYDHRLRLQSYSLTFEHPITNKQIEITLPDQQLLTLESLALRKDYLPKLHLELFQRKDMFCLNSDTAMLGDYMYLNQEETILDIGTNNGALLLYASRFQPKKYIGVDIFFEACELARINLAYHQIPHFEIIEGPIQEVTVEKVDVIVVNPPYFKVVDKLDTDQSSFRFQARHEATLHLQDLFAFMATHLSSNGRIYMIHRLSRLEEIQTVMKTWQMSIENLTIEDVLNRQKEEIRILLTIKKESR